MTQYRKKPVEVEAFKFCVDPMPDWFMNKVDTNEIVLVNYDFHKYTLDDAFCGIKTLEGTMVGNGGDYIIKGVEGEIYPCDPDIFAKTYEKVEQRKAKVISGFPGVGKTSLFKNNSSNLKILDSDSSNFSWDKNGNRNIEFPDNYIEHIKDNLGKVDYIFVSSHDTVIDALEAGDIDFTLVYPDIKLKSEYLERYRNRGNDEDFIHLIDSNWEKFIKSIMDETHPFLIELKSNEFLSDVIDII